MKKLKLLSLTLLMILVSITNVYAIPETFDRTTLENYGVNKKWQVTDSNKQNVLNTHKVDATKKVYDFSDVLSDEEEATLQAKVADFTESHNVDLVIVIDNVPYTYDSKNQEYESDFYDYNDFGMNYDKYDGVIFFRNTYEADPYYDAASFGEAQLYYYSDRLNSMLDSVYADIHAGNYMDAFDTFISDLDKYYENGKLEDYYVDDNGYLQQIKRFDWNMLYLIMVIASLGISFLVVGILSSKNKMVLKATRATEYMKKGSLNITNKKDRFVSSHTTHYTVSSDSGSGGGGGFSSSSGSSGGGFSSGGGRHG